MAGAVLQTNGCVGGDAPLECLCGRKRAARRHGKGEVLFFQVAGVVVLTGQGLTSRWGRPESPSLTALFDTSADAPEP